MGAAARNVTRGWNASVKKQTPIAVRERRELRPCISYARYADDFTVVVKGKRAEVEAIREELRELLERELRLTLNLDKTHVTHVNDGFVFLGHRIIRKRGDRGHMRVVTGIPFKSSRRFAGELTAMLSRDHHLKAVEMIKAINRKTSGWTAFYRHAIYTGVVYQRLDTAIFWKLAHWLARRAPPSGQHSGGNAKVVCTIDARCPHVGRASADQGEDHLRGASEVHARAEAVSARAARRDEPLLDEVERGSVSQQLRGDCDYHGRLNGEPYARLWPCMPRICFTWCKDRAASSATLEKLRSKSFPSLSCRPSD